MLGERQRPNPIKPKLKKDVMMKKCSRCGAMLPLDSFQKNPRCADGHLDKCKQCMADLIHEGRIAKKEARKAQSKGEIKKPDNTCYNPITTQQTPLTAPPIEAQRLRLEEFTFAELIAEIKRRGWEGQLTKTIQI